MTQSPPLVARRSSLAPRGSFSRTTRDQRRKTRLIALTLLLACALPAHASSFVEFESGQVRPLALSPDGATLFAVNTPDNRLEIFSVGGGTLTHTATVPVGMEPVAVAARTNTEVWVVNHLSDSVSVVDVGSVPPRVVRTLLVGDEPRDIVFAGPGGTRAFITTAHRGQNRPGFDPQLTTAGVGRSDVFVFDALNLGSTLEGTPITVVRDTIPTAGTLFGDTPRALAVSPDGNTVYAAVFHSGNRSTTLSEGVVCNDSNLNDDTVAGPCTVNGVTYPGGLPNPERSIPDNQPRPETGLIVKYNGTHWVDRICPPGRTCSCQGGANTGLVCTQDSQCPASPGASFPPPACGRNWDNAVKFSLPDKDVFAINAAANPPVQSSFFTGVGTVIFNMAVNPVSGKVYVSNTDARNEIRFEGPGGGGSTVRGHLHEARITVLSGATVTPRRLNKHIDYSIEPAPSTKFCLGGTNSGLVCTADTDCPGSVCAGVKDNSLATPLGMAITANGQTLYAAAFGSSKIGVFATSQLENDTFVPSAANHIHVAGGGPTGMVLDETHSRLYVLTRFDNGIAVIDTSTKSEVDHLSLYNPEPASVLNGRSFLYDAFSTSSNGEASCSSCHIFGDFDSLAWDLGNPDDSVLNNPNPIRVDNPNPGLFQSMKDFHPLKGPMTTQSLRGMANHGPMHWRGDRTGGNDPGGDPLSEDQAFKKFNVAFAGLLGRSGPLTAAEMQAFTDFILQVTYPPNPIRNLDNSLTSDQQAGRNFFMGPQPSDIFQPCNGCHRLDPANGFFGSDGFSSFEAEPQFAKIPHLRNLYQKVGMFGMPSVPFFNAGDNGSKGNQIRGFGFLHDGSVDTVFRFHNAAVFNQMQFGMNVNPNGFPNGSAGDPLRRQVEQFMLAMDSNMAPIVGQQLTLTSTNGATVGGRIDTMIARAFNQECDLTVKGTVAGEQRGWYKAGTTFRSDRASEPLLMDAALRALAATPGQELTYTCVPPGSGERVGVDRDEDGAFDRDELDAGSDPADPLSVPPTPTPTMTPTQTATPTQTPTATPTPTFGCAGAVSVDKPKLRVSKDLDPSGDERLTLQGEVIIGTPPNPVATGLRFEVDDKNGALLYVRTVPAGAGWSVNGTGTKWTFKDRNGTLANHITKVVITDRTSQTPGKYTFKVTGKDGDFQVTPAEIPAHILVMLGNGAGQCASRAFNAPGGLAPACNMSSNGKTLNCR